MSKSYYEEKIDDVYNAYASCMKDKSTVDGTWKYIESFILGGYWWSDDEVGDNATEQYGRDSNKIYAGYQRDAQACFISAYNKVYQVPIPVVQSNTISSPSEEMHKKYCVCMENSSQSSEMIEDTWESIQNDMIQGYPRNIMSYRAYNSHVLKRDKAHRLQLCHKQIGVKYINKCMNDAKI